MRPPIAVLVAFALSSFAAVAAADVAPPDCATKKLGDPCTMLGSGTSGVCANSSCYSPLPDGGSSGPWGCLRCVAGAADAGHDAGTSAPTDSGSSGCSMGGAGSLAGAFGIAMAVPLLLRRRRRS